MHKISWRCSALVKHWHDNLVGEMKNEWFGTLEEEIRFSALSICDVVDEWGLERGFVEDLSGVDMILLDQVGARGETKSSILDWAESSLLEY